MLLFTIALLSQLSTAPADPCTQLDATYEELELMDDLEGEEAKKRAGKLVELAARCGESEGGQRKSLEGYSFAFLILQTEGSLPSSYCAALKDANVLAGELTKTASTNARIAGISKRLAALANATTCDEDNIGGDEKLLPVASGKSATKSSKVNEATPTGNGATDGSSDETDVDDAGADTTPADEPLEVEGPKRPEQPRMEQPGQPDQSDTREGGSPGNLLHLKRGVIAMGVVTGVSLAASGILQGVTYAENLKVIQALEDDNPQFTQSDPCKLGKVEQGAESYCGKLNDLKVATIVGWSLAGASAIPTVAMAVVYAKKRKKRRTAALTPRLQLGRHGVLWGVGGRF